MQLRPRPRPRHRSERTLTDSGIDPTINIVVGSKKTFQVHKHVLKSSPFLNNIAKSEIEAMGLPEEKPRIFELYLHWLYSKNLHAKSSNPVVLGNLAKAYVLGEALSDADFQRAVMNAIILNCEYNNSIPSLAIVNLIYRGTTASSPARRLMIDFFRWVAAPWWRRKKRDESSNEEEDSDDLEYASDDLEDDASVKLEDDASDNLEDASDDLHAGTLDKPGAVKSEE
ncbi:hypothetical protein BDV95DRAFT_596788 [Massariosphaeria phaeospora]|uniref:BTB domain-containing protein n=1 Tax=Massariosphaeria phaeospora TaxID=100035 RepID=A0A7C8I4E0_9PLEO|nr:hypothetical protein BDV95DRAFT_596788 [Massariosphaeria phaeospora]